jgi:glutamyl/glutaminyl-tRNA synthetase
LAIPGAQTVSELVRTRFAPSPTGYLHIGGARTALFNYLLARRLGGRFVLRIEDTDQTRNVPDADRKLLEDLRWLGLQWDEGPLVGGPAGPYHQSERLEIYQEHARRLLDAGQAYYAFETREELTAMRAAAQRAKRNFRYPRPARFPSEAEARRARETGRPVVVRFRMPEQEFIVRDAILGEVRIGPDEVDDFVILKADGWPTYHFAVVVDDELMGVTHVLRGQEHLMNTPNHLGLQRAFGFRTPVYAHLPIILNADGSKMGKRRNNESVRDALAAALASARIEEAQARELAGVDHDTFAAWRCAETNLSSEPLWRLAEALGVTLEEVEIHDFRRAGYLPEVVVNFIALLGWSPGGDREKMTLDEMCALFSLERIGRTNARFDREKLLAFNADALAAASRERRLAGLRDFLAVGPPGPLRDLPDETLLRLLDMNPTPRTFSDIRAKTEMLFVPDEALTYDRQAVEKVLLKGGGGLSALREARTLLASVSDWSAAELERVIRGLAESRGTKLGHVAQPIRVAVTGGTVSPPIFDTLALLGRERTLARIDRAIRRAEQPAA